MFIELGFWYIILSNPFRYKRYCGSSFNCHLSFNLYFNPIPNCKLARKEVKYPELRMELSSKVVLSSEEISIEEINPKDEYGINLPLEVNFSM